MTSSPASPDAPSSSASVSAPPPGTHLSSDPAASLEAKSSKRVSRACARCSASKRRCDGRRPSCAVCLAIGVECQYSTASIRRGPPKGFRSGGQESVKSKLLRTLETTLRDLVGKLGEEQTEDEVVRIAAERKMHLTRDRDNDGRGSQHASTSTVPSSSLSLYPTPNHDNTPHVSGLTFDHPAESWGRQHSDWRRPESTSVRRPALSDSGRPHKLPRLDSGSSSNLYERAGASWGSTSHPTPPKPGDGEESDILGVNEHGDTMHRGSSSGLQLLSRRTLPPLPGNSLPLLGSSGARTSARGGSGDSPGSCQSHGALSASPLMPRDGMRVPLPAPRRSGSGTCPGSHALSGSRRSASAHSNPGSPSLPNFMRNRGPSVANLLNSNDAQPSGSRHEPAHASQPVHVAPDSSLKEARTPGQEHAPRPAALTKSPSPADAHEVAPVTQRSRISSGGIHTIEAPIDFVDPANDPPVKPEESCLLFTRYWHHVHSEWPVLFKPAIQHIEIDVIHERMDSCLLYAIYAIASCIVKRREEQSDDQRAQEDRGMVFYRRAQRYLFASGLRPTLSSVQALFLLAMYAHGTGDLSQAWVYHNLSVAMALDMGLHRWPIPRLNLLYDVNERETRVRLIWHIYILGQMLSAEMGRPVTLKRADIDVPFLSEQEEDEVELVDLDDFEPADEDAGRVVAVGHRRLHVATCINQSITLFSILEGILTQFHSYGRKAALRKKGDEVRELVIKYDEELESWHDAVPSQFRADELLARLKQDRSAKFVPLPAFIAVEMWYQTAKLLLHRNFIPQDQGVVLSDVLNNQSFIKATHSAQVICDMLETTAQYMRVDRLSTDLAYCFFTAAVTFIFNSRLGDKEIVLKARRGYVLCREALVKLSETWPAASSHKQLLDGFSYLAEGWDENTRTFVSPPRTTSNDTPWNTSQSEPSSASKGRNGFGYVLSNAPLRGPGQKDAELAAYTPGIAQPKDSAANTSGSAPVSGSSAESASYPLFAGPGQPGLNNSTSEDQGAHMGRLYEQSVEGVRGRGIDLADSAQAYAPGLFDLEQVFFNEWRPGMQLAAAAASTLPNNYTNGVGVPAGSNSALPATNKGWYSNSAATGPSPQGSFLDSVSNQLGILPSSSYVPPAATQSQNTPTTPSSYLQAANNFNSAVQHVPVPPAGQLINPGVAQLHMLSQQLQYPGASAGNRAANPYVSVPGASTGSLPQPSLYDPTGSNANNELFELMALLQLPPNFGL